MVPKISASNSSPLVFLCCRATFFSWTVFWQSWRRKPTSVSMTLFSLHGILCTSHWGKVQFTAINASFSLLGSNMAKKLSATLFSECVNDWKSRPMAVGPMISRVRRLYKITIIYLWSLKRGGIHTLPRRSTRYSQLGWTRLGSPSFLLRAERAKLQSSPTSTDT